MKFYIVFFLQITFYTNAYAQPKLDLLINVYQNSSLTKAKESLVRIPKYQLIDTLVSDTIFGKVDDIFIKSYLDHNKSCLELEFAKQKTYNYYLGQAKALFKHTIKYARGTANKNTSTHTVSFSNYDYGKLGKLTAILQTIISNKTQKVIYFKLILYPYSDD